MNSTGFILSEKLRSIFERYESAANFDLQQEKCKRQLTLYYLRGERREKLFALLYVIYGCLPWKGTNKYCAKTELCNVLSDILAYNLIQNKESLAHR